VNSLNHILFLCSWYPNKVQKTNGNFIEKHAQAVATLNKVSVLNIQPVKGLKNIEIKCSRNENLLTIILYIPQQEGKYFASIKKYFSYKKAYKHGIEIAEKEFGAINLVHLNHVFPLGALALFQSIPFVVSEHYSAFLNPINRLSKNKIKLASSVFNKAKFVFPVSETLKNGISKLSLSHNRLNVIGNVVDTAIFNLEGKQTPEKTHFIHISNGDEDAKNLLGILHAIKQLSKLTNQFQFTFICDGDIKKQHEKARELGLLNSFVFFEDEKSQTEIAQLLKNSTALVMFSNYETFGIVTAEALACGTPVIATEIAATQELVHPNFGILVPCDDTAKLANAMLAIIENTNPYPIEEMHQFIASNFSKEQIAKSFQSYYNQIVK
jgi:glycosyltransferase involved in cell wall biosynthesis